MKFNTRTITTLGVLIALEIILNRFLSINAWNLKIGFSFVPVVLAAMLFGPIPAAIVAALGDLIGAILFPIGAYFPGFTLTAALTGLVFGLLLKDRQTWPRVLAAVAINQLILSFLLNSYWISVLYGSPFVPLLATRIVQCAILAPVQFVVILALARTLPQLRKAVNT